uniref:Uncharacterized protein n=1 Tax=Lactuca sativa TaxID=4236 RepID=A0A9R1VEX2_LACSA|nr:hypothetical protein LSAT_V11C500267810 [Lactuca sativa]
MLFPTATQNQEKVGDLCIADTASTHTILKSKKYFSKLVPTKTVIHTISGPTDLIKRTGNTQFILPNGTKFCIENSLFSPKSNRNLLSFNHIYFTGYDTKTVTTENKKYMYIIDKNRVLDKLPTLDSGSHLDFSKEFKVIYVDQFIHHLDHLDTLWS